jgi:hypothetical protein
MNCALDDKIKKQFGEIVCKFPVLHHNWEYDGYGYIVTDNKSRSVVLTNHGVPYVSNVQELNDKIAFYKTVTQQTERSIFLLANEKK